MSGLGYSRGQVFAIRSDLGFSRIRYRSLDRRCNLGGFRFKSQSKKVYVSANSYLEHILVFGLVLGQGFILA